jgi:hypothetical protein
MQRYHAKRSGGSGSRSRDRDYSSSGSSLPTCDVCSGNGICQKCHGAAANSHNCPACRPRGDRASDADWGKCWPCHGKGRKRSGSTMYDRRARTDHEPTGASGLIDAFSGEGHSSQWYDDGYRVSRDTDGQSDDLVHWTDQSKGKHHRDRHKPPPDAR